MVCLANNLMYFDHRNSIILTNRLKKSRQSPENVVKMIDGRWRGNVGEKVAGIANYWQIANLSRTLIDTITFVIQYCCLNVFHRLANYPLINISMRFAIYLSSLYWPSFHFSRWCFFLLRVWRQRRSTIFSISFFSAYGMDCLSIENYYIDECYSIFCKRIYYIKKMSRESSK